MYFAIWKHFVLIKGTINPCGWLFPWRQLPKRWFVQSRSASRREDSWMEFVMDVIVIVMITIIIFKCITGIIMVIIQSQSASCREDSCMRIVTDWWTCVLVIQKACLNVDRKWQISCSWRWYFLTMCCCNHDDTQYCSVILSITYQVEQDWPLCQLGDSQSYQPDQVSRQPLRSRLNIHIWQVLEKQIMCMATIHKANGVKSHLARQCKEVCATQGGSHWGWSR